MKHVVFVDLDNTLFQTHKKNKEVSRLVAVGKKGEPLSFQSPKQIAFFQWLSHENAVLIPVTGRTVAALRRVRLPFSGLAVCSFGGVILAPDGTIHTAWDQHIAQQSSALSPPLEKLCEQVKKLALNLTADVRCSVVEDAGRPLYLSIKSNRTPCGVSILAQHMEALVPNQWLLHVNGSNMALLPTYLSKKQAVSYLMKTFFQDKAFLSIGIGDSLTDYGFMSLCDFSITPGSSQIMGTLNNSYEKLKKP